MKSKTSSALAVERRFTSKGKPVLDMFQWTTFEVGFGDKKAKFEAPSTWTANAAGILADKYAIKPTKELPEGETSAKQVFLRLADTFAVWAKKYGYLSGDALAAYRDELLYALASQALAPNSPVWFNCGRYHKYGMKGQGGQWRVPDNGGPAKQTETAYVNPQMSACFIQRIDDTLFGPENDKHGIYDVLASEARLFKYGSGTGSNFSAIRSTGEPLAAGGTSSGLPGFLEAFDASAGVIKSGGTTRRAAKMVILDIDHPDVEWYIGWKAHEENKARALIAAGYSAGFEGEAVRSIKGQNSNNSVLLTDKFMEAVLKDQPWDLTRRVDGKVVKTVRAKKLWDDIAQAAWACADPGTQYNDAIQRWHTCKNDGPIRATNPCSEYIFLNDTSCNLLSLNLMKFLSKGNFDAATFVHLVHIAQITMDLVIQAASFPTKSIAERTRAYRTTGGGYANMGALLMSLGLPYGSREGRAVAAAITSLMTAESYLQSTNLAEALGPFERYEANKDSMLEVIQMHLAAAQELAANGSPIPSIMPGTLTNLASQLANQAVTAWSKALERGAKFGFRNAQTVVIAPTGTIGLVMGCDTTGIEPAFTLLTQKTLVGGGKMILTVDGIENALRNLGYSEPVIQGIRAYIAEQIPTGGKNKDGSPETQPRGSVRGAPGLKPEHEAIFATANDPMGNSLTWKDHLEMVAAIQPFLSGGVSKTINLPNSATVEDIGNAYLYAWRLGCKNTALYRDGSKVSQVLGIDGVKATEKPVNRDAILASLTEDDIRKLIESKHPTLKRGYRKPVTQFAGHAVKRAFKVNGERHHIILTFERNGDGKYRLMEIFWGAGAKSSTMYELSNRLGEQWSKRLREGVSAYDIAEDYLAEKGAGGGMSDHPVIKTCESATDFLWRHVLVDCYGKQDFVNPEIWESYMGRLDRDLWAYEELQQKETLENGALARPATEAKLTEFVTPDVKPNLQAKFTIDAKCPRCASKRIVPTGTCKTCLDCGTSIGGC